MKHLFALFALTASSVFACSPTSAWLNYTPTIGGMTNVTIESATYSVDANCNVLVQIAFRGTAVGGQPASFTTPAPSTTPWQVMNAVIVATGVGNGGGAAAVFATSVNTKWVVVPYDARTPAANEVDEYRVQGMYH